MLYSKFIGINYENNNNNAKKDDDRLKQTFQKRS